MKAGITGHQNIGNSNTVKWVADALSNAIRANQVSEGITSLAIGADQLFAEILRGMHLPYTVIVPCQHYENTFHNGEHLNRYRDLLSSASIAITLSDNEEPSEFAFLQAGQLVVDTSDVVIAVWNGEKARGTGGTGDIVQYARAKGKKIIQINPVTSETSVINKGQ